jgi:hypothetical protein
LGGEEKDAKPMRVGSLERVKPTFLFIETPKYMLIGYPGLLWAQVHGRRQGACPVMAGRGSTLKG